MNELTLIDLFSGIGGFSLAGRWAGFRTVCFSEVDPYASAVLRKHWPDVPNVGDIRTADFSPYSGATVLTGGFPCQPFSVAGNRRGAADDRFLWPEMLRAIECSKPDWVVGENVAGIIQMELDRLLSDLEGIGYTALPFIIPACAVDAPHRRERVWIVAQSNTKRELQPQRSEREERRWARDSSANVPDTKRTGLEGHGTNSRQSKVPQSRDFCRWETEPNVGRVANGISNRVDRIRCLGNSIVPQVAFEILRSIAEIERQTHDPANRHSKTTSQPLEGG